MPQKAWTFSLDGQIHHVVLEYSYVSAKEKFWVDDDLISNESRWTLKSHYNFSIGQHQCQVTLKVTALFPSAKLMVDNKPVEILPSQILLRPSQQSDPNTLLRPHNRADEIASEELLRPGEE
jgi:hypothetical protein